jgi:hypothetical protein
MSWILLAKLLARAWLWMAWLWIPQEGHSGGLVPYNVVGRLSQGLCDLWTNASYTVPQAEKAKEVLATIWNLVLAVCKNLIILFMFLMKKSRQRSCVAFSIITALTGLARARAQVSRAHLQHMKLAVLPSEVPEGPRMETHSLSTMPLRTLLPSFPIESYTKFQNRRSLQN